MRFLLTELGIPQPSYLDIGAYDPIKLSNTCHFYRTGCAGICVEPNPILAESIRRVRPRDICLQAGVAGAVPHTRHPNLAHQWDAAPDPMIDAPTANFYVMSTPTLSSFSSDEAARLAGEGYRLEKVIAVPIVGINAVLRFYGCPDFVSLDIEGMDTELIHAWDFDAYRPAVFCLETISFSDARAQQVKDEALIALMEAQGYLTYADTRINTIFVDRQRWQG